MAAATTGQRRGLRREMIPADDPDVQLMLRCKSGDDRAFTTLFERYKRKIVNFARRYLHDPAKAEDAAQEVFLRLYRARASYEPQTPFRPYLYRIATNTCLNHVRKRDWLVKEDPADSSRESVTDRIEDTAHAKPEDAMAGKELQGIVEAALSKLPESQRTALLLLRFEELSYEEIATVMDATVPAVKSLLNRAKNELLRVLGPHIGAFAVPYGGKP